MGSSGAVIVGGGVVGLASAWEAARRDVGVTVVDPSPGHWASWVAGGMLAPVAEASFGEEHLVRLLLAAADRWPAFAARLEDATGVDVGYRRCGSVVVAADGSDRRALDQLFAFQQSLDLPATRLSASECRRLVPALAPGVHGGVEMPGDHQVDNRRLVTALLAACRGAGVRFVERRAESVVLDGSGAACGVALADGETLGAQTVLVAAGVGTPALGGVPEGVLPPVRPVKGVVLRLRGRRSPALLERTVRGLVHGRPCYLVPRGDGSVVLGASSEERGFDRSVQAGTVHDLLDDARTLVPGVDELELEECLAGLRPGSPDNCPFVGPTSVARLAVATGHFRNGILLTPLTGETMGAYLAGEGVSGPLAGFPATRLAGADPRSAGGAA